MNSGEAYMQILQRAQSLAASQGYYYRIGASSLEIESLVPPERWEDHRRMAAQFVQNAILQEPTLFAGMLIGHAREKTEFLGVKF